MKNAPNHSFSKVIYRALFPLLVLAVSLVGCVTDPVTGQKKLSFLSHDQEVQLGQEGDQQIVAQYGVYDDAGLASHVNDIGQTVAAKSDDPSYPYTFRILNTADVNAFALPGGYVYVTRGLLAYLENDAQLAFVLGHEIGHVNAHHTARQMASADLANLAIGIGGAVFKDIQPFLGAAQTGLQLLFLSFSRDDEREADELGVRYATRAGFKASEGAKFFGSLLRIENQQQGGSLPSWESTHPGTAERIATVTDRSAYWEQQDAIQLGGINPEQFVPRLQNLVFGQDPREGFVQNGTFYLPSLAVQFPVPSGWQVANFATQIQMASADGNAAILMTASAAADPQAAAQQFVTDNKAQVISSGAVTVNGFSAYRVQSNLSVDDGNGGTAVLTALSYFISEGNSLFVFHGYTTQAMFSQYSSTFEGVFSGFRQVTDQSVLSVQPTRLSIIQASRTDQFQSLVQPISGYTAEDLAILNQVQVSDQIQSGAYLKQLQ